MISAIDWRSVSTVYKIPIPAEIKAVLDSIPVGSIKGPPSSSLTASGSRSPQSRPAIPSFGRRDSSSPPSRSGTIGKTAGGGTPPPPQTPGRGQSKRAPLTIPDGSGSSTKSPASSSSSSPNRRAVDLADALAANASTPRRSSVSRAPTTPKMSHATVSVVNAISTSASSKRGTPPGSVVSSASPTNKASTSPLTPSKVPAAVAASLAHRSSSSSSSSSSSGSSDGGGSGSHSDHTVTSSDGGFTDYLSDESEAELQRQAEARAALQAQSMAEENEFKAARLQLQHVDLRPPKSWNTVGTTAGGK